LALAEKGRMIYERAKYSFKEFLQLGRYEVLLAVYKDNPEGKFFAEVMREERGSKFSFEYKALSPGAQPPQD